MIVRPGPIFGSGDDGDELTRALRMLAIGAPVIMPSDEIVSPTYVPDLVNASLDLLIDGEHGIWHLANRGEASLYQLVKDAAVLAEVKAETLRAVSRETVQRAVLRPACRALGSERGEHLPSLADALARYAVEFRATLPDIALATEVDTVEALSQMHENV